MNQYGQSVSNPIIRPWICTKISRAMERQELYLFSCNKKGGYMFSCISHNNSTGWKFFAYIAIYRQNILHKQHSLMMTSSNGNLFRVTGPLWWDFTGHRWIPPQRPVTRSVHVFFDLKLNKWLNKHKRHWWFETPWYPLWRQCNACD